MLTRSGYENVRSMPPPGGGSRVLVAKNPVP
jgi:hypothetical protein